MPKTAISFKVPEKLWGDFKHQTDRLFISRAPFLNYMLHSELVYLREDLAGMKLSLRAKRHISGQLKRSGAMSVNIEVDPETANALRAAVKGHNLVRDAFLCRLIIFLRSTDAFLKLLEIPRTTDSHWSLGLEEMPSSPLGAMEAVRDDPLYYVRSHLRAYYECGVYSVRLPERLDWAACYLSDENVPGTASHRKREKQDQEMFALLDMPAPKQPSIRHSRGRTK